MKIPVEQRLLLSMLFQRVLLVFLETSVCSLQQRTMDAEYSLLDGDIESVHSSALSVRSGCPSGYKVASVLLLVAFLGLSAHSTKNAMVPAEPVFESMGLSPFSYSLLWAAPTVSSVVFAPLWGLAYGKKPVLAIVAAPLGTLAGQALMVGALMEPFGASIGVEMILVLGWTVLCISRAGGEVVQHSVLAQMVPRCLTSAFIVIVFATHMSYVMCNLLVPRIIGSDTGPTGGAQRDVLRVQTALLIPSLMSVVAGCLLACTLKRSEEKPSEFGTVLSNKCFAALRDWKQCSSGAGILIILWGAVAVGVFHAYQSVTDEMLVSLGLSVKEAGTMNAYNQAVALVVLACTGLAADVMRQSDKLILLTVSLVAFGSAIVLLLETCLELPAFVWRTAFLAFSIVGVLAPVLPLALIPQYVREPAKAYGCMDSLKGLSQFLTVLLIGRLREAGGFPYAMLVVCAGAGSLVALVARWLCFGELARGAAMKPWLQ